jgi:hypothetical protein
MLRDALAAAREPTPDPAPDLATGAAGPGAGDPGAGDPPARRITALAVAYRRFALDRPALYSLMFERPLPDFDPAPQLRAEALGMTFTLLTDEVAQAQRQGVLAGDEPTGPSYLLWTTIHGITSIELTHALRSPLPGWFVDSPEAGEQVLVDGVRSLLAGLRQEAA